MAFLKISDLRPAGSEFFQDSESYLNELNEQEISATVGGGAVGVISQFSLSIGVSIATLSAISNFG
ncbi:hypothetical protein NIES4071_53530 [Calothrix sp. NIES-4071]|nr:hypothetical protein NIES4071_53530 [Calothrix sp. NIES-4071]BAZ59661.1 hypothetical protein NIES4105_53480 [Calothrix sp. NIES-4105]